MLLGIKSKKTLFLRHFLVGLIAALLVYFFWLSRPELFFNARLWRALADSAFSFLFFTLVIGPLSRLWKPALRLMSWRRETGIWFALLALAHFIRVSGYALSEQGIELPRLLGLIALFWALVLAVTSSDRAVNFLSISSWKWLHLMTYVIFYLIAGHAAYFLFWRYSEVNWFQYPFLVMALLVSILQISAFIKEVMRQRAGKVKEKIKKLKLPVLERKIIAEKTCEVSFDLSGKDFNFSAGQHIQVQVPNLLYPDPRDKSRTFSIISSPNDKSRLSIAFRDSGSGFKQTLKELPSGSIIDIQGPFGYFTLLQNQSLSIIFVVGGIGITPCLSMIRFAAENKLAYPMMLLYANRSEESTAYLEELKIIKQKNPHFSLKNKMGRVDAEFIKQSVENLNDHLWYVVGPPAMSIDTREVLSNLGVDREKIYFEDFTGY